MLRIYKYQLETTGVQEIEMPQGAIILSLQTQNEVPCIWALVNPNTTVTKRTFMIFGTGHKIEMDKNLQHVGTYQLNNGFFVGHCFEVIN